MSVSVWRLRALSTKPKHGRLCETRPIISLYVVITGLFPITITEKPRNMMKGNQCPVENGGYRCWIVRLHTSNATFMGNWILVEHCPPYPSAGSTNLETSWRAKLIFSTKHPACLLSSYHFMTTHNHLEKVNVKILCTDRGIRWQERALASVKWVYVPGYLG